MSKFTFKNIRNRKRCYFLKQLYITCKNDSVQRIVAPQLDEMHGIAKSETRMTAENDAGLSVIVAESLGIRGRIMLQSRILHEESVWERFLWKINFVLLICR